MSFTTGKRDDTIIVSVEGQLIVGNRQELKQMVLDQVEQGERRFLIDFSQTVFIDSSGLGALVSLSKTIRERGGEVRLANLNDDLRTLFELTKLDTLFRLGGGGGGEGATGAGVHAPLRPPPRAGGGQEELR
jgi:anti-sigma B factor antagonist